MTIDKRLALIDRDGVRRYPYMKHEEGTKRYGFALGRDRHGQAEYTQDIRRVIEAVVIEGLGVRARPEEAIDGKNGNTVALHPGRAISSYWLAPEFFSLIEGAKFQPINRQGVDGTDDGVRAAGLERLSKLTAADYLLALEALGEKISPSQRAMLVGHASVPSQTLSMADIAAFGGYASYEAANTQYGKVGSLFASHFGLHFLENATQAIADAAPKSDSGHWRWKLRPALVQAMVDIGLVEGNVDSLGRSGAEREIDSESGNLTLPETTRQALINARIGQGSYRQRMLRLWGGRCAVSSCSIESVLVASHAKAWRDSTNDERRDEYNGLLLAASIDRLFDGGLIAFADEGNLLVGTGVTDADLAAIGLTRSARLRVIHPRHKPYLAAHRAKFGFNQ